MIITYEDFVFILNSKIKSDDEFFYELLCTVVSNPNRYTGIFRLSSAKTKLIQNVTQSREIKFGDFMEDIVTKYIEKIGYKNLPKAIGFDEEGNSLSADQVFKKDNRVYLIEQKIRDDHDSTKKRGQYENFRKKYTLLKKTYPSFDIVATMWFIDKSLVKNKNFYLSEANSENLDGVNINIYYGEDLFSELFGRIDVWEEMTLYLAKNKKQRSNELLKIPDFDTSNEIFNALLRLKIEKRSLFNKLVSDKPEYIQLRKELFPTEYNLKRII